VAPSGESVRTPASPPSASPRLNN